MGIFLSGLCQSFAYHEPTFPNTYIFLNLHMVIFVYSERDKSKQKIREMISPMKENNLSKAET